MHGGRDSSNWLIGPGVAIGLQCGRRKMLLVRAELLANDWRVEMSLLCRVRQAAAEMENVPPSGKVPARNSSPWVFFFGDFEFGGVSSRGKSTSITVDNVCYHTCSSLRHLHKTNNIYVHHFNQWRRNEFESGGHRSGTKVGACQKFFFWSCSFTLLALKVQLVVLVSTFVMVSTVWSVSCLLFFYLWCPPCPVICKSWGRGGGTCPSCLWSRRHCLSHLISMTYKFQDG